MRGALCWRQTVVEGRLWNRWVVVRVEPLALAGVGASAIAWDFRLTIASGAVPAKCDE